jgi:hypothetical protein
VFTKQISYASTLPISLAEAQNFCRVDATNAQDSALLTLLIQSAVQHAENVTGLSLASKNYVLYLDRFPGFAYGGSGFTPLFGALPYYFGQVANTGFMPAVNNHTLPFVIPIDKSPVTAVTSVTYIDLTGNSQTLLPGQDFEVDLGSEPARIGPLPLGRWPIGQVGLSSVQVAFTAGYTATVNTDLQDTTITVPTPPQQTAEYKFVNSIPADLKLAMLILINDAYQNREMNVAGAVGRVDTVDDILIANKIWDFSQPNY